MNSYKPLIHVYVNSCYEPDFDRLDCSNVLAVRTVVGRGFFFRNVECTMKNNSLILSDRWRWRCNTLSRLILIVISLAQLQHCTCYALRNIRGAVFSRWDKRFRQRDYPFSEILWLKFIANVCRCDTSLFTGM